MNIYFTSTDFVWLNEANNRGFDQSNPLVSTKQWGSIRKHPDRDEWCVEIPQEWLVRMGEIVSGQEMASNAQGPFTREQMDAGGWFPQLQIP